MKNIYLLFGLIAILTYSCKQEEKSIDYAVLSGKLITDAEEVMLLSPSDRSFSKSIPLSADGSFLDTLRLAQGAYILREGRNMVNLYIDKGMDLKITADASDFVNTISVSGNGSEISNYLLEKSKITNDMVTPGADVYKLDEDAYKSQFNKLKTTLTETLDTYEAIPAEFKEKEKRNLHYSYLKQLNSYGYLHAHYAKKPDFKPTEGFLEELKSIDYENLEDFNFSPSYKEIVTAHFREKASELAKSNSIPRDIAYIHSLKDIKDSKIKNDLLIDFSRGNINYTKDLEEFYSTFNSVSTIEDHKTEISETYKKLKLLTNGNPSPNFENYENYAGGTMSLADFKGKYLYVDVWATWCGPCIAEIPSLKEIEKKYHGKNIEIVSISVDKPDAYDKWRGMISEKELSGTQLLADNDWNSEFVKGYLINGIPRFILIDPNGNIVDSNAPRPSDPKLIALFNDLKI